MADFNLQFLNGVGESYDKPARSYQEREVVSPLTRGDYGDGMLVDENGSAAFDNTSDALIYDHHCHCHTSRLGRIIFWMAVGAVGAQMLKKLFKE